MDGLKQVKAPGMKPIKEVELYKKWRKHVPEEYQDEICPKPSDEVLAKFGHEKKDKQQAKKDKEQCRKRKAT